ncbi:hypothetical protein ILYODFUR_024008 [Ilyodon furcidens]|uniref:Uncharacterized protein n=1 Tax=Ilyodon furcidens TaxID=33524 RepID=A0ABV0TMA2_9TELE
MNQKNAASDRIDLHQMSSNQQEVKVKPGQNVSLQRLSPESLLPSSHGEELISSLMDTDLLQKKRLL